MTTILNKEAILACKDLKQEIVEVPEWGGSVIVRTMTGTERDAFEQSITKDGVQYNTDNIRARLVSLTLIDEDGNRLFTDKEVESVGGKAASALVRLYDVAQRLNGMSDADVDELAKN